MIREELDFNGDQDNVKNMLLFFGEPLTSFTDEQRYIFVS